jgi:hypothetical protein
MANGIAMEILEMHLKLDTLIAKSCNGIETQIYIERSFNTSDKNHSSSQTQ